MENAYDFTRPITDWEYTCIEISEPIEGVKLITLNRPECLNAISIKEARDFENALQELRFDNRCRVVILTGAGRGFCAGTDLKEMSEFTKDPRVTRNTWLLQKHMANIIELMRHIPQPVIAAVNGPAAGGGASFAMAADIRIASTNAKFINAQINVGMSGADMGSSFMLPRLIGVSKAAELIYTGRPVLADEGERIGLFNKVVAPEELMDTALEYAKILLGKSEMGLLLTKECLNAAMDGSSLDAQLHIENRSQTLCAAVGSFGNNASNFTNKEKMINTLYRTGYIGKVELKNRLVMGPAGFGFCDEDKGAVNDRMIEFFRQRARGGVGLIDVGAVQIDADHYTDHDMVKLYSDEFIDGFKRLADAVHAEGAKIMGQLLHQGRYCASREYFGEIGIGPSAVYTSYTKETPRELTTEECEELIEEFGMGAERLVKAGFDIVEICTNSGYLIGQFLSPLTNLRSDRFGGSSVEERFTFLREVILRVRRGVGPDMPISVRIGGNDFVRGSNTNEDACRIAALIEQTGGDCINVTGGWHETFLPQVTMDVPFGAYSYLGKQIKESVSIPVIQSNRMCIEQAEKLMYEDTVDFISMVRPLVADPYLMNKAAAGRYSEIRPCVGCNQGCLDHIMRHKPITCLVNAEVGREAEVMRGGKLPVESASTAPERILVVGAGPAGMEFARIAASRGHGVTIWEEKDHLGGQFDLNSVPPGRHDFARFRNYLAAEMARLGVTVVTGKKADAGEIEALVSDGSFDRVVIATGAKPICPPIPVEEGCSVVQAWDVLLKKAELGKNVVIVGGGAVGVETAEYIAEMGTLDPQVLRFLMLYKAEAPETLYKQLVTGTKKVTVIEMQPKIGRDIGITTRWGMLQRLKMYGVTTLAGTKVLSVEKAGVRVQQGDGTQAVIPADTVVLAVGSRSENALYGALEGRVRKLTLIGDAEKPAFILDAVRAAYDAAIEI